MKVFARKSLATTVGAAAVAAIALFVGVADALADGHDGAGVGVISGRAQVLNGENVEQVDATTKFETGDVVRVAAGSKLKITIGDDTSITLSGPAQMAFVESDEDGHRVRLLSGVITTAEVGRLALEIQTPYDASLVLQNASAFARVAPGDKVSFEKLSGEYCMVYTDPQGDGTNLEGGWTLDLRSGESSSGAVAGESGETAPDARFFKIGERVVGVRPGSQFSVSESGGTATFTYMGDDYGVVTVGSDSAIFLANGESVTFDESGHVVSTDGTVHVYHPIYDGVPYDEPIENAGDASISDPGRR